ncbi:MAG: response regulator [Bacteroidetes bacterium]|nr:response regulator [Bacteroidota bacterium]
MKDKQQIKIFLVDDDALFLKLLEIEFMNHSEFIIETYATGELCMENIGNKPDVIILDYFLNGVEKNAKNGIETLDQIKAFDAEIPVIMLSAQDKIDVAIDCMRHKALDYVVKSETSFLRIQKIIDSIFQYKKLEKQMNWYMERM